MEDDIVTWTDGDRSLSATAAVTSLVSEAIGKSVVELCSATISPVFRFLRIYACALIVPALFEARDKESEAALIRSSSSPAV
jgi:hypothetical protein